MGSTLDAVGDADDAANVAREVLRVPGDDGSVRSRGSVASRAGRETAAAVHGRLLACRALLDTRWGAGLAAAPDLLPAIAALVRRGVRDRDPAVRAAACRALGPLLGKAPGGGRSLLDGKAARRPSLEVAAAAAVPTGALRELRGDVLARARATERGEVQLALAEGLTAAARMRPDLFLCREGRPILDAGLLLATSCAVKRPDVQKAFQIFLWAALRMGGEGQGHDRCNTEEILARAELGRNGGLKKYIELAEGQNGMIMMKFVTQTLAKIEELDDQDFLC